ncbi:MAG: type IV pili twitching motility protein PilT, partial [Chromatiales bacterium]|nr:type IV pili twitching motility protein PilT [Chromatiales bacterium]
MEIEALLAIMVKTAASDLFITANLPPRMMVNGRIRELKQPPLSEAQVHELVTGLMTPEQQDEFKTTMECNFA